MNDVLAYILGNLGLAALGVVALLLVRWFLADVNKPRDDDDNGDDDGGSPRLPRDGPPPEAIAGRVWPRLRR